MVKNKDLYTFNRVTGGIFLSLDVFPTFETAEIMPVSIVSIKNKGIWYFKKKRITNTRQI